MPQYEKKHVQYSIEHGDGGQRYVIVSGTVPVPEQNLVKLVVLVTMKLQSHVEVNPRMTETVTVFTSVAYSQPMVDSEMGPGGHQKRPSHGSY